MDKLLCDVNSIIGSNAYLVCNVTTNSDEGESSWIVMNKGDGDSYVVEGVRLSVTSDGAVIEKLVCNQWRDSKDVFSDYNSAYNEATCRNLKDTYDLMIMKGSTTNGEH